jgi:cytochrome oxidase Cu insertion factor (SCO1/SenC/PrrC family)
MRIIFRILLAVFVLLAAMPQRHSDGAMAQKRKTSSPGSVMRYSCPMHPEVVSKRPGKCPKCGMKLRAVQNQPGRTGSAPDNKTIDADLNEENSVGPSHIPDTPVYDQDGRRLNFYTDLVKGKTVAINFIFTTCTTICPPLTATFRHVQQELGERVGRDVYLISVSVDPVTDVPERLRAFAAKFNAGPGWIFVTGAQPDIDALLKSLGAGVADKNDHTSLILIGNESRAYWVRTYGLAPSGTLVKLISEAANKRAE